MSRWMAMFNTEWDWERTRQWKKKERGKYQGTGGTQSNNQSLINIKLLSSIRKC